MVDHYLEISSHLKIYSIRCSTPKPSSFHPITPSLPPLAISKTPQVTSSIGHQIIVQLISKLYSGLFFLDCANGKSPADQILKTFKSSFGTSPAVGHSILWICDQQTVMYGSGSKSQFVWHPAGITVWFKYIIPVISGGGGANDSVAKTVKISSLKYIELVLKG